MPARTPVMVLNVTPDGNAPTSLSVGAGDPVAVTVKVPNAPAVKVVLLGLVIAGEVPTVSVAEAGDEFKAMGVVTAPLLSRKLPTVLLVTVTKMLQVVPAGTVPLVIANVPPLGAADSVPPQPGPLPLGFGAAAFVIWAGYVSVKATFSNATALGL